MNTLNYRGYTIDIDVDFAIMRHRIIFNKDGNKFVFDCFEFSANSLQKRFILKALFYIEDAQGSKVANTRVVEFGVSVSEFEKLYAVEQQQETASLGYNISSFKRVVNGVLEALTVGGERVHLPAFLANFSDKLNCFKATDGTFYQPTVYDIVSTPGQVTVNVVNVDGIPEYSIDDLTWQDSNIFSGLSGPVTVYVRSKTNLMKTSKTVEVA